MTYTFHIKTPVTTTLTIYLYGQWDEAALPTYETEDSFGFGLVYAWLGTTMNERGMFLNPDRFAPKDLYEALSLDWGHGFEMEGEIPDPAHQPLPMAEQWEQA